MFVNYLVSQSVEFSGTSKLNTYLFAKMAFNYIVSNDKTPSANYFAKLNAQRNISDSPLLKTDQIFQLNFQ